jgi:hypothetical protein
MIKLISGELRYVLSECVAEKLGVAYDPSGDVVKWAFVAPGSTVSAASWTAGTWETVGTNYKARILVGAGAAVGGDVTLAAGTYEAYWKVTDNPEAPIEHVGRVAVRD